MYGDWSYTLIYNANVLTSWHTPALCHLKSVWHMPTRAEQTQVTHNTYANLVLANDLTTESRGTELTCFCCCCLWCFLQKFKDSYKRSSSVILCFFPFHQSRVKGQVFKYATRGILTGLTANTKYKIWMTASTADKEGEKSNVISVQTCKRPKNTPETYWAFNNTRVIKTTSFF